MREGEGEGGREWLHEEDEHHTNAFGLRVLLHVSLKFRD